MEADPRLVKGPAASRMHCSYFFAYGTLRRGARNDLLDFVGGCARLVGRASVPGRLYDLGDYPGMLDAGAAEDRVFGELYELADTEWTLSRLDEYEGCESDGRGKFRRCIRSALLDWGSRVEAWTYVYVGEVSEHQRVATGDYFRRRE